MQAILPLQRTESGMSENVPDRTETTDHAGWLFKGWCRTCPQPYELDIPAGQWPGPSARCDDCGTIIVWGEPQPICGRMGLIGDAAR
jgi:hypothetical protein